MRIWTVFIAASMSVFILAGCGDTNGAGGGGGASTTTTRTSGGTVRLP